MIIVLNGQFLKTVYLHEADTWSAVILRGAGWGVTSITQGTVRAGTGGPPVSG